MLRRPAEPLPCAAELGALASRIGVAIRAGEIIALTDDDLLVIWNDETRSDWRLLRLHLFASRCRAWIVRGEDGTVVLTPRGRNWTGWYQFTKTVLLPPTR